MTTRRFRCPWGDSHPLYVAYHDTEWGVPQHDDGKLFEMLLLEGAQAGLSWITVLKKREGYRRAFSGFDLHKIARYDARKMERLLANDQIIRNRLKIAAAITNARAFLAVQADIGSFARYLWQFVDGRPKQNAWKTLAQIPARTTESDAMSKDLKHRGFKFVGSTICYAHMQATGLVNDHLVDCFRYRAVQRRRRDPTVKDDGDCSGRTRMVRVRSNAS